MPSCVSVYNYGSTQNEEVGKGGEESPLSPTEPTEDVAAIARDQQSDRKTTFANLGNS